jgi:phosphate transport system ATP-binding protein
MNRRYSRGCLTLSLSPLIQTEQLSLHYGEKPVFADVTLPIQAGCITALVGPSGCGKTSF